MTGTPFEDPAKSELRARCEVAIDQAGHEVVAEPAGFDPPAGSGLRGRVKGDLQSVDGDGRLHLYYVRPGATQAVPKWLANLAASAREIGEIAFHIVVDNASSEFIRSCRAVGAGLLVLTEDDTFMIELDFDTTLPEVAEKHFVTSVDAARRALEAKLSLNQTTLESTYTQVSGVTGSMDAAAAERYKTSVERDYQVWSEWATVTSSRLDTAYATRDAGAVASIADEIARGPDLDSSSEEAAV